MDQGLSASPALKRYHFSRPTCVCRARLRREPSSMTVPISNSSRPKTVGNSYPSFPKSIEPLRQARTLIDPDGSSCSITSCSLSLSGLDHLRGKQPIDASLVEADLTQHLDGVLAKQRRREVKPGVEVAEVPHRARLLELAPGAVLV